MMSSLDKLMLEIEEAKRKGSYWLYMETSKNRNSLHD